MNHAALAAERAGSHRAPEALRAYAYALPLRQFDDGAGARWRYRDNGASAKPALVLLPGALGNGDAAWRIAQAFDADRRAITLTYPGGLAPDALATGLKALLDTLETGPVALWGSSYGAWWAQAFAARFPQAVEALWLSNTFVDGADVAASPLFDAQWLDAASDEEVIERWDTALHARPDDLLRAVQLHMLHHGLDAHAFHGRLRQVARAVALPAGAIANTVISDCANDPTITPEVRARVRARYPQARHLSLADGGHYPHIVAPDALASAMRAWLR